MEEYVKKFLKENKIKYKLYKHKATFTVKESNIHCKNIPGLRVKNLFLKNKKNKFFLYTLAGNKKANLKKLKKTLKTQKLHFANEKELTEQLKLKAGSVSPLGLINTKKIQFLLDKEINEAELIALHPNINTETIVLNKKNFQKLIKHFNPQIINFNTDQHTKNL